MKSIINLLSAAFFIMLLVRDIKKSESGMNHCNRIRLLACIWAMVCSFAGLMIPSVVRLEVLSADLLSTAMILLVYPCSFENTKYAMHSSEVLVLLSALVRTVWILFVSSPGMWRICVAITMFLSSLFCILNLGLSAAARYSEVKTLFKDKGVLHNLELASKLFHALPLLVAAAFVPWTFLIPGILRDVVQAALIVVLAMISALLLEKAESGRCLIIFKKKEGRIREAVNRRLPPAYSEVHCNDAKMNALYSRVRNFMAEKQPFLDPLFSMNTLSKEMYSNKLYLSKTINTMSGRNFRQFINCYRVEYAMALMRKDPHLRINEVSDMSGFNNIVSFNMAFKTVTGQTPSEWLHNYLISN